MTALGMDQVNLEQHGKRFVIHRLLMNQKVITEELHRSNRWRMSRLFRYKYAGVTTKSTRVSQSDHASVIFIPEQL